MSSVDHSEKQGSVNRARRFSLHWTLLAAFGGAFSVVFLFLAIWIFQYTTTTTTARLQTQLQDSALGGAQRVSGDDLAELIATVPPVPDPSNPTGLGYPDSPLYASLASNLFTIYVLVPEANPYTYYRDPDDGQLYFAVSAGYMLEPHIGVPYKVPVSAIVDQQTYGLMEQGLSGTVAQEPYTDQYGSWISTYTPIYSSDGTTVVGAIGVDYPLTYVDQVARDVQQQLYPVLGISYVVLLALVLVLSTSLTRPLRRLTAATERIASGEYDVDVQAMVRTRFPDEVHLLTRALAKAAAHFGARERALSQEVQRLKGGLDSTSLDGDA